MRVRGLKLSLEKEDKNISKREIFFSYPYSSNSFYFLPTKNDWKIIKKYLPKISLYLTNRCNIFCRICFSNSSYFDNSKELSKLEVIKILKKIGRGKRVTLMGGEPTCRKDLFEIIRIIRKSGNYPELFTNGLKLSDFQYVKKLKEAGIRRIYFSFDGFDKKIYEKINNNDNLLLLKLLALKNIQTLKIPTIISARIVKGLNEKEVKRIIEFCANLAKKNSYIKGVYFFGATKFGRFELANGEVSFHELTGLLEEVTKHKDEEKYLIETKRLAINIYKVLSRFGIFFTFGGGGMIGLYRVGSVKRQFSLQFLKRMNEYFKRGLIFKIVYESLKIREIRKMLWGIIRGCDIIEALPRGVFIIGIGNINTPSNQPTFYDCLGFEKINGRIFVNAALYSIITEAA
jgi:molybdenum cofactor biosynthesis enzyme MoaA